MKRKLIPPFVMLVAGLITSIRTYVLHYDVKRSLLTLLVVLIVFYILGSILKYILDTFEKQNEEKALDEGEVIAKAAENDESDAEAEEATEDTVNIEE